MTMTTTTTIEWVWSIKRNVPPPVGVLIKEVQGSFRGCWWDLYYRGYYRRRLLDAKVVLDGVGTRSIEAPLWEPLI